MDKVLVVTSGKGGTGKSTLATSIGIAFAKMDKKVLLIDCDCGMRGLDIMLGVSKNLVFDISDAVSGNCKTQHIIYPCPYIENLYLIPAPQSVEDEISGGILKKFIKNIESDYDYIIIDSPAGIGKNFEVAVIPADLCLVIVNAEPTSVRGCEYVKKRLEDLNKKNIRMVINKFSKREFKRSGAYYDLDEVIDKVGLQLLGVVEENKAVVSAIQKGVAYNKECKALKEIENIAKRINGENVPLIIN